MIRNFQAMMLSSVRTVPDKRLPFGSKLVLNSTRSLSSGSGTDTDSKGAKALERFFTIAEASTKGKLKKEKAEAMAKVNQHELDTGTPEAQIAALTVRIDKLREHFAQHKKDVHSRRGLERLLNRRRKTQKYLRRKQTSSQN
mmetsp:Transcript_10344/g.11880  ORF Transcript_10344/g.11880 Transcript_10344/m.11880 type:complete len:142 (-) Transcript_10344:296-721(-)